MGITASLITTFGGTLISAISQKKAGTSASNISSINAKAIEDAAEANAQLIEQGTEVNAEIAMYNARMSEAKAKDAIYRGREEETRFRFDLRGLIAQQRAKGGASGFEVESGSALEVQTDTAYQGEFDALTLRTNAAREAWGFKVEAEDERQQAAAMRKLGKLQATTTRKVGRAQALSVRIGGEQARTAASAGAASTILGGVGNILQQFQAYKRAKR